MTGLAAGKEFPYLAGMIIGKLTAKAQITIPRAVRLALGLKPGDDVVWEIDGDQAILTRGRSSADPFLGNFSSFSEWSGEADCAAFDRH